MNLIKNEPQMLELAEKDVKMVIITVFHMFKKLSKNMEDIKKIQIKLLMVKTRVCEVKNILSRINSR